MHAEPDIALIAPLIGDASRARILRALMDGRAKTAKELALEARVTPQTASSHLAKLLDVGILAVEAQSRNRYFRLAGAAVAHAVEALTALAPPRSSSERRADEPLEAIRAARMCYDHLAGQVGVAVTDAMIKRKWLKSVDRDFRLTPAGERALGQLGIDVERTRRQRRAFARPCLDWSERRMHLGGALGAALAERFLQLGWLRRAKEARVVILTDKGRRALPRALSPLKDLLREQR